LVVDAGSLQEVPGTPHRIELDVIGKTVRSSETDNEGLDESGKAPDALGAGRSRQYGLRARPCATTSDALGIEAASSRTMCTEPRLAWRVTPLRDRA
jgi:hypothetical protein